MAVRNGLAKTVSKDLSEVTFECRCVDVGKSPQVESPPEQKPCGGSVRGPQGGQRAPSRGLATKELGSEPGNGDHQEVDAGTWQVHMQLQGNPHHQGPGGPSKAVAVTAVAWPCAQDRLVVWWPAPAQGRQQLPLWGVH